MLSHYRVLDLTEQGALVAGQILADLGAEVIQVEPRGGARTRRSGPFATGSRWDRQSLFWAGYARNKRGVELDFTRAGDRAKFLNLIAHTDVVLESFDPGYLSSLGLGYDELAGLNPRIVCTSITPFGQTGPKAHWPASDLTVNAASGALNLFGDPDRAPLAFAIPQAFLQAGADAVLGTLVALHERNLSGRGQHVDVSAQHSASYPAFGNLLALPWNDPGAETARVSGGAKFGGLPLRFTYPAKDGYVTTTFVFGNAIGPAVGRLFAWVYEEGFCDEETRDTDWIGMGQRLIDGSVPLSELFRLQDVLAHFTATKTKLELFDGAKERHLLLAPIATSEDLIKDPNLQARQYWTSSGSPDDQLHYPGPFAKFSACPITYRRRAPDIGEHDVEVFAELSSSEQHPAGASVSVHRTPVGRLRPFAGLNVVDFGTTGVVPYGVRLLRDFGATIVKIDGTRRLDTARTLSPMLDGRPGPNRSGIYGTYNAGKLGLAVDITTDAGRAIALRLAAWADIVVEGFSPTVMPRLGLDYADMRKVNPKLIYLSSSVGGRVGTYTKIAGYGNVASALAGFNNIAGWPDRPPVAPGVAYTDNLAPRFLGAALLAALENRERTGEGQHIDLAQMEAAIHFLTPAVLDYVANKHITELTGNRALDMAPHGIFPCRGANRWVAVAVRSDDDWRRLCSVDGLECLDKPALIKLDGRKEQEEEIEERLSQWTSVRTAEVIHTRLVAVGVPAHVVAKADDLHKDPQLWHRGHLVQVQSPDIGNVVVESPRFILSRTSHSVDAFAPSLGEHNYYVLRELLGYSETEITEFAALGVLE